MMEIWSEVEVRVGTALYAPCLLVHTVQSVISPCRYDDMLVKLRQNVHQFYVVEVPHNHIESLRVLVLERTDGIIELLPSLASISIRSDVNNYEEHHCKLAGQIAWPALNSQMFETMVPHQSTVCTPAFVDESTPP